MNAAQDNLLFFVTAGRGTECFAAEEIKELLTPSHVCLIYFWTELLIQDEENEKLVNHASLILFVGWEPFCFNFHFVALIALQNVSFFIEFDAIFCYFYH